MVRASALYLVLVIALVISVFSVSLISVAFYYREEYLKSRRYDLLLLNQRSGIAVILSPNYLNAEECEQRMDLFGRHLDSISIKKESWGIFSVAIIKSFIINDSLKKAFFIGKDSAKDKTALYLADEDRPLLLSGDSRIIGNALLPKAGVKKAFVDGRGFSGDKLISGTINNSGRELPLVGAEVVKYLESCFSLLGSDTIRQQQLLKDYISNSFFQKTCFFKLKETSATISHTRLSGKIIILCDTTITIDSDSQLKDVVIFARSIVVKKGFKGACQLFARDSIITGENTSFEYPSVLGIISGNKNLKTQPKIVVGDHTRFCGVIFCYEKNKSALQSLVSLGKQSSITGDVFGELIKFEKNVSVFGKIQCNRFIMQTSSTLFENYLIDIKIDLSKRGPYYLNSPFLNKDGPNKILKWLE